MAFVLIIAGLTMVVTGARDTYSEFGRELRSDFTGEGNFTYWIASIIAIGAVGYYAPLKTLSNAFLALVLISFVLANGGFFDQFKSALAAGPTHPQPATTSEGAKAETGDGGIAGSGVKVSDVLDMAKFAMMFA